MVVTILLACGVWTLVRTGGFTGDFDHDFAWRWSKTPEEQLLAQTGDGSGGSVNACFTHMTAIREGDGVRYYGSPLTVVQSAGGLHDGETYNWQVSNQEFNRAKRGEPEQMASDLDFLLRDAFKIAKKPMNNPGYAQVLMTLSGKEFTADVEWSWYCNDEKNIRVPDGQGGYTEVEQKGCGSKYYQGGKNGVQKSPQDPGQPVGPANPLVWPERIICGGKDGIPCGAAVRAFPNLRNLRP